MRPPQVGCLRREHVAAIAAFSLAVSLVAAIVVAAVLRVGVSPPPGSARGPVSVARKADYGIQGAADAGTPGAEGGGAGDAGAMAAGGTTDTDDPDGGDGAREADQAHPALAVDAGTGGDVARAAPPLGFSRPDAPVATAPAPVPGTSGGTTGAAGGGQGPAGSSFMGVRSTARNVVYVIDFSGSMADDLKFEHTKVELRRSIQALPPDGSFCVIFFDDLAECMPGCRLVPCSAANKRQAIAWLRTMNPRGGTDPCDALELALRMRPEAIFLMTDGAFNGRDVFEVIDRENADRHTSINTIAFHDRSDEPRLRAIADENRGDYRYVAPLPRP